MVDRWYHFSGSVTRVEIRGFSDASLRAYGSCVYLNVFDELGNITSSLAAAKSKVAPLKKVTIPKLELLGAVILSELVDRIRNEFSNFVSLDSVHCWVDSMVALHCIWSEEKHFCAFIQKRVEKIRSLVPVSDWLHVNASFNPADILSRGALISQIQNNEFWLKGPTEITLSPELDFKRFSLMHGNLIDTAT